jgi:DNA-binding XRE family transcriptional regulator
MNRFKRGREMAGLSVTQAAKLLGISKETLSSIEEGSVDTEDSLVESLSRVYGSPVRWLRGESVDESKMISIRQLLRDHENISSGDRDTVLEFAGMLSLQEPRKTEDE